MKNIAFTILFAALFCSCQPSSSESSSSSNDDKKLAETAIENQARTTFKIKTVYGEMLFELFNETPQHKANFLKLVKEGFYDSLMIHRVQQNFMIQAGDPDSRGAVKSEQQLGNGSLGYTLPAEINSKFVMQQGGHPPR